MGPVLKKSYHMIYLGTLLALGTVVFARQTFLINGEFECFFVFNCLLNLCACLSLLLNNFKQSKQFILSYASITVIFHFIFSLIGQELCSIERYVFWLALQSICTCLIIVLIQKIIFKICPQNKAKRLLLFVCLWLFFIVLNLYDLASNPSLFFYNPFLGFYHGPIYDAFIPLPLPFISYRLWNIVCVCSIHWIVMQKKRISFKSISIYILLFIVLPMALKQTWQWNHSHKSIQKKLGSKIENDWAELFFDSKALNPKKAQHLLKSLSFEKKYIESFLITSPKLQNKINIYVYPNYHLKKQLSGSAKTFIGNAMQNSMHLLYTPPYTSIYRHELSHILQRHLGFYGLSPSPAMLEGSATAIELYRHGFTVHQWAKVIVDKKLITNLKPLFSPFGFWSKQGYQAYLSSGSFLRWLHMQYPNKSWKNIYIWPSSKRFKKIYGTTLDALQLKWIQYLNNIQIDPKQQQTIENILSHKPIFKQSCPHTFACLKNKYQSCTELSCQKNILVKIKNKQNKHNFNIANFYLKSLIQNKKFRAIEPYLNSLNNNTLISQSQLEQLHIYYIHSMLLQSKPKTIEAKKHFLELIENNAISEKSELYTMFLLSRHLAFNLSLPEDGIAFLHFLYFNDIEKLKSISLLTLERLQNAFPLYFLHTVMKQIQDSKVQQHLEKNYLNMVQSDQGLETFAPKQKTILHLAQYFEQKLNLKKSLQLYRLYSSTEQISLDKRKYIQLQIKRIQSTLDVK